MKQYLAAALCRPATQLAILTTAALLLRASTFGDPNLYVDESFYLLVGHEMHLGAIPYVDIWDRKPLGLFIAYWMFAAFRNGVLAYQIGAWLSCSATAWVLCRIASRWMAPDAALCGGLLYLAMLGTLLGMGGQGPVFYNGLVAGAALLVLQYVDGKSTWRLHSAMLLLGLAITFKPTVVFEAAFLGLFGAWHHLNCRTVAVQFVLGVLPSAAIAAWYVAMGHWPEFYHAMVTANIERPGLPLRAVLANGASLLSIMGPLLAVAIYAGALARQAFDYRFMSLWLCASLSGFLAVPFMVNHYALPMLVPLCIVAGAAFTEKPVGAALVGCVGAFAIVLTGPQHFERHRRSRAEFDKMVAAIGPIPPGRGLLVYDGPPLLYLATHTHPMSPLAFPGHLWNMYEKDLSQFNSGKELERIVAERPAAVVMRLAPDPPPDLQAFQRLEAYVRANCGPPVRAYVYRPSGTAEPHLVYSSCV